MVQKVFFALEGSGTDRKIDWPYVLISAANLWVKTRFKPFHPHKSVKEVFLDSGGFSFFARYAEYPYYPAQYIRLAHKLQADYVAVMDYPCEPDVNRSSLGSNKERIDATIENAIRLMDLADDVNWVMVVQGYTLDEYAYAIDRIKEQGLLTPLMAVGSLCVRRKIWQAREVIRFIRRQLPGWVRLHGFGVDLRLLWDREIFRMLYSSDTGAWKWTHGDGPYRLPRNEQEKLKNYQEYKRKVEYLMKTMNAQTYWDEHWYELIPNLPRR